MSELKPVIYVDKDKCVNCHRCISVCPSKMCNDGTGDYVSLKPELCLGCGHCIEVLLPLKDERKNFRNYNQT